MPSVVVNKNGIATELRLEKIGVMPYHKKRGHPLYTGRGAGSRVYTSEAKAISALRRGYGIPAEGEEMIAFRNVYAEYLEIS